jgi:hypothetical protein
VLKVDAEGCEVQILESIRDLLAGVRVLYVEYDTVEARRQIDRSLESTHELCHGFCLLDQGEMIYVRRQLLSGEGSAASAITSFFRERLMTAARHEIRQS